MDMGEAKRLKEAALEAKREAFNKDPDRFIDREDLIMAAFRTFQDGRPGWDYAINKRISDDAYKIILFDLNRLANRIIDIREVQAEAKEASKLIVPDTKIDS